jgi:NAD(P)-dependent dehydrogenase (short-subunit alcohol dehydrogenase family)
MSDEPRNLWFITGATSGFGRAIAEAVATRGDIVVGAARSPARLDDLVAAYPDHVHAIALDVTDTDRCSSFLGANRSPSGLGDRWQQTAAPARALQAGGCPFEPGTTHPLGIQRRRRC